MHMFYDHQQLCDIQPCQTQSLYLCPQVYTVRKPNILSVTAAFNQMPCSGICYIAAYSLCDWLLLIRGDVDDLVALLPQDVQHTVVPQEVT